MSVNSLKIHLKELDGGIFEGYENKTFSDFEKYD
jgi:hypothetical protein